MRQRVADALRLTTRPLLDRMRAFADRRARRHVLVLGDSHVRVFEHWQFLAAMPRTRFEIVYVPGATAIGLDNPNSRTRARDRFREALARGPWDRVLIDLGEVDTAAAIWRHHQQSGRRVDRLLDRAVETYTAFLADLCAQHRPIVLAATLPTLGEVLETDPEDLRERLLVAASQRERTDLAIEFNRRIALWCAEHGVPHLDSGEAALGPDRLVRDAWKVRHRRDHHYAQFPFARWLVRALRPLLKNDDGPTVG